MLRITIPGGFHWHPGQHVFVRFLTPDLHALSSHPFTICSLPQSGQLMLYVRVRGGLTARLAAKAKRTPGCQVRVWLDGPYGGMQERGLGESDRAVVISGGSGAGFTLPLILDVLIRNIRVRATPEEVRDSLDSEKNDHGKSTATAEKSPTHSKTGHNPLLHVILATRNESLQTWYLAELAKLVDPFASLIGDKVKIRDTIRVDVHVTGPARALSPKDATELGHVESHPGQSPRVTSESQPGHVTASKGRPDLPRLIREATTADDQSVGIAVCGPPSMLQDVRNGAAEAQARVLKGVSGAAREVHLHTEVFE